MIRVNLLKTRAPREATQQTGYTEASAGTPTDRKEQLQVLLKIAFLAASIAALMVHENLHIASLKSESDELQAKLVKLRADLAEKQKLTVGATNYEAEAKALQDKLAIMKNLAHLRLREVKALDYLQTILPQRAWFTDISFENEKLQLRGYSMADDDLNSLLKALETSVLFTNVVLLQAKETKVDAGTARSFEISASTDSKPQPEAKQ